MIETGKIKEDKFRLSCSLYELVEIWSMRGAEVELVFLDENGKEQIRDGVITNIFSREGLEQMEMDKDLIIPTRNIVSINGTSFKNYMQ